LDYSAYPAEIKDIILFKTQKVLWFTLWSRFQKKNT